MMSMLHKSLQTQWSRFRAPWWWLHTSWATLFHFNYLSIIAHIPDCTPFIPSILRVSWPICHSPTSRRLHFLLSESSPASHGEPHPSSDSTDKNQQRSGLRSNNHSPPRVTLLSIPKQQAYEKRDDRPIQSDQWEPSQGVIFAGGSFLAFEAEW